MIPLTLFLFVWLILLVIFLLFALISVVQMLRYSVAGTTAYITTSVFIGVVAVTIFSTGLFLVNVDWSQGFNLGSLFQMPEVTL